MDIVDRLEAHAEGVAGTNCIYGTCAKAAAEITRLRKERDEARALVGNETTLLRIMTDIRHASGLGAMPMLSEIAGEISRIRAERDEARAAMDKARNEMAAAWVLRPDRNPHGYKTDQALWLERAIATIDAALPTPEATK